MYTYNLLIFKISLLIVLLFSFSNLKAQTEVFKSNLYISDDNLTKNFSSISIDSTQIYVNSNDYYIHAFDKKTGQINWSYYLANKSNTAPIIHKNSIIVEKHVSEYYNNCIQLNSKTGDTIQTLNISEIFNQPLFKNDIMYTTAISSETGGCILAYDLNKNKIIWKQFVAHGVAIQPYFLKNKIIANAEDDNWFDIDYNGVMDTLCKKKTSIFVENIKCVKNFLVLTHDNKEIDASFLTENLGDYEAFQFKTYNSKTFFIGTETLLILGNNKKVLHKVNLNDIILPLEILFNEYKSILKIENTTIWFFSNNKIVEYDFQKEKVNYQFDLSKWNPHRLLLENDLIYLISKKDGQLYKVQFD